MNSQRKTSDPDAAGVSVLSATRRLLKPLVKLLISQGVTLPALSRLLKSVYVEVAEEEFTLSDRKLTDSRVSLLTGVHRKDVQKLRNLEETKTETPGAISIGTRLVATWIDDPAYLDEKGKPRILSIRDEKDEMPGFEHLVEKISKKDLHARVILDELVRLEVVTVLDSDHVSLNTDAFVPDNSFNEKAWFFGENLSSHMAAGVHNLLNEKPAILERSVSYSGLNKEDVERLQSQADELGMEVLKELNREARKRKQARAKKRAGDQRFTFGVYLHNRAQNEDRDMESETERDIEKDDSGEPLIKI